jgi:uncharacterized protein (DUF1800 family)
VRRAGRAPSPTIEPATLAERLRRTRELVAAPRIARDSGPAPDPALVSARLAALSVRPRVRLRWSPVEAADVAPFAIRVLGRMGFGPRPGDIEAFNALAGSDSARLGAYIEEQLFPDSINDGDLDNRLVAAGLTTLAKTRDKLWADHVAGNPDWYVRLLPAIEIERAAFLRAIYSRRQLFEVLADFWHDHFNVYGWDYISAPTWVYYDRDVIRANVLGNFRTMLGLVAASPAMMVYLNTDANTVAGPNENYARELCELHTLGAENYLGVVHQDQVPHDAQGRPIGYADDDVYEITRCFTGWTLDEDTGATIFRTDRHDRFQKHVLGRYIAASQAPFKDGNDVLDSLASHPGTARFIARKLCRRLIGDEPPQRVVDEAAAAFAATVNAPDQLRQVVRAILLSEEFATTWAAKVKRPFEVVVSALRAAGAEISFALDSHLTDSFFWLFEATGHAKFSWRPPNGYPDAMNEWLSTATLVPTWRVVNWTIWASDEQRGNVPVVDLIHQSPAGVTTARGLADFWIQRILGRPMSESARTEVIEFLAQGRNPDVPLHLSDDDVESRLYAMAALIAMAPQFLWR